MERLPIKGIIRLRELPEDWTEEQFRYWWCDDYSESGRLIRRARMTPKEKNRYTVLESENLITTNGISNLLTFIGLPTGTAVLFFKFFAVGTGLLSTVAPSDTALATELFRKAPTGSSVTGNQQDVSTLFTTGEGNGTWTNAGAFGASATSTPGSGTLMTHALYSYAKTNAMAITNDYVFILTSV